MQRSFGCSNLAELRTSHNLKLSLISLLVLASPSCINCDGQWLSQSSFTAVEVARVCVRVCAGMCLYMDPVYLHVSDISDCAFNGSSCCSQLTQTDMNLMEPPLLQYPDWKGHML